MNEPSCRCNGDDSEALALYANIWAVHQLLQLHQQSFLFPQIFGTMPSFWLMEPLVIAVLLLHDKRMKMGCFMTAIVVRNVIRAIQCPFLWDSEFWLALTDLSVLPPLVFLLGSGSTFSLTMAAAWVRRQLAICYGAAAFFKLNTSFLDSRTSCAPIFALSLLSSVLPKHVFDLHLVSSVVGRMAPTAVVVVEAAIAISLWFGRCHKWGVGLALIFHFMVAVTPAPNGVPTFSCVAASRLILILGNNGGKSAHAALHRFRKHHGGFIYLAVATVVAIASKSMTGGINPAILLYLILASHCGLALVDDTSADKDLGQSHHQLHHHKWLGRFLVGLAAVYAFVPPILGLQEIGSNTMFANMRLHGGTNHLLGVPTGLLQSFWYQDSNSGMKNSTGEVGVLQDWFGGGIVRVEYTNSDYLNRLYPGEITTLLDPELRYHLQSSGHVGRQFNPKARRVLGPNIRMGMPFWKDDDNDKTNKNRFVKYTVPALEFRRLLTDAREYAVQNGETFHVHYTRLDGATGDENWRKRSPGKAVQIRGDDGNGGMNCRFRDGSAAATWEECQPSELAYLKPPPAWALKFMLFYPYAILPDDGATGQKSADELLCNY